jgi:hypothetical protein
MSDTDSGEAELSTHIGRQSRIDAARLVAALLRFVSVVRFAKRKPTRKTQSAPTLDSPEAQIRTLPLPSTLLTPT